MRRALASLADTTHDLLIIGGGIHGACAAWDASLRGLSTALVDRGDLGAATSANSLKIVHGGLRHLQRADLFGMRESNRERSTLLRIAPHLVRPLGFLIGAYEGEGPGRLGLAVALRIADLAGRDAAFPESRIVPAEECLRRFPFLPRRGLTGGALWYDGQMRSSERLTLSFLLSAAEHGAKLANYVEARELIVERDTACGARVRDVLGNERFEIRARFVLNAAGPWADRLLPHDVPRPMALAVNAVIRRPLGELALGIRSPAGRYLFLVPWRSSTLVGTLYRPYNGSPDEVAVCESDLRSLLDDCNTACPGLGLSLDEVTFFHGGLVPLAGPWPATATQTEVGPENVLTIHGAKYTTARATAERVVDRVVARLGRKAPACGTRDLPIYGGERLVEDLADGVTRRLAEHHGSRAGALARLFRERPGWCDPLAAGAAVLRGEILHAVRDEMACKLADVVLRRTEMGTERRPPDEHLQSAARCMAAELGWTAERERVEVHGVLAAYRPGRG